MPRTLAPVILASLAAVTGAAAIAPSAAVACVYASEADTLIGLSKDGAYALYGLAGSGDTFQHAEIHPTRAEGSLYWIDQEGGRIRVRAVPQADCSPFERGKLVEKARGALDRKGLLALPIAVKLGLVDVADVKWTDGAPLRISFEPKKRFADHRLVIDDPADRLDANLIVPVWCVGSCLRDEAHRRWSAAVLGTTKRSDRTLYRVRMERVCNAGHGDTMWIERVISAPAPDAKPPRRRACKGAG